VFKCWSESFAGAEPNARGRSPLSVRRERLLRDDRVRSGGGFVVRFSFPQWWPRWCGGVVVIGSRLVAIGSWLVIAASTAGIVLLVGIVIAIAVKAIWIVRRSGGVARSVWPWLRQIAWLHLAGAAAGFSVASAAAQDFVSSHHDLMAATFSADGVVPSLSQMFHGRVLGAAVLVAAAAAAGLSLRLLRRVIGSTWRLLRSPVVG